MERLSDAGRDYIHNMDLDDMAALKLCLLSTGALFGLSVKNKFARRLTGLGCTILAAGLAVPLVSKFWSQLEPGEPILGVKVEKGEEPEAETLFEFKVEKETEGDAPADDIPTGDVSPVDPPAGDVPPADDQAE